MTRAHVLMLTPYLPYPPFSGGRMRTYNLVKRLAEDHRITLLCFGRPEERALDYTPMAQYCDLTVIDRDPSPGTLKAALLSLTTPRPITMRLYGTPTMKNAVAEVLARGDVDIIHVESFYMMQNLPQSPGAPVLLSEPAIEYKAWARHARVATPWFTRPGVALEALKMRIVEPNVWARADLVGAMSDIDAAIIERAAPSARAVLTPNGVDVDFFDTDEATPRDPNTALYIGDYKYFPNSDAVLYFAEAILPRIRARRPDFRFTVVGKDPGADIKALHGKNGVEVTGLVDDTRPYFRGSAVFVCPLRSGSGTRFKLMEALACGCPVVSTTLGAEGLGAVDGEHMLIRDDPDSFAEAVVTLLDDPTRGQAIGEAGRAWVVAHHAWAHSAARVRDAYAQLLAARDS
jgi:sugar transferase (PEP-CTERM/EpsH1 system associated)